MNHNMSDPKPRGRDRGPGVDWKTVFAVVGLVSIVSGALLAPVYVKLEGMEKSFDRHMALEMHHGVREMKAQVNVLMQDRKVQHYRWSPPAAGP